QLRATGIRRPDRHRSRPGRLPRPRRAGRRKGSGRSDELPRLGADACVDQVAHAEGRDSAVEAKGQLPGVHQGRTGHRAHRAAGSIGDPTRGGATLTVYNSAGLTNEVVVVDLQAGGWSRVGGSSLKGYRFKGVGGGPIKSVVVKADEITVKGGKDKWTYTLN